MGHVQYDEVGGSVQEVEREEAHVVGHVVVGGVQAVGSVAFQAVDLGGVVFGQNQGKLDRSSLGRPRTSGDVGCGSDSGNGCSRPEAVVVAAVGVVVALLVVVLVVAVVDVVDAAGVVDAATADVRRARCRTYCC